MFRQSIPQLGLALEEGTPRVPADGRYYILKDNQIQKGFASEKSAVAHYRGLRDKLLAERQPDAVISKPSAKELRERVRREHEADAVLSKARADKRAAATRRGGGGRRY